MPTISEIITLYNPNQNPNQRLSSTAPPEPATEPGPGLKLQTSLTVPEQARISICDESPIDRFGPQPPRIEKRRSTARNARRSSCYSRYTNGKSIYGISEEDYLGDINEAINESIPHTPAEPPALYLSPDSARYTTQHSNESKLIFQGLSDPYHSRINSMSSEYSEHEKLVPIVYSPVLDPPDTPESDVQPVYADDHRAAQTSPPFMEEKLEQFPYELEWNGSQFSLATTPPIRPSRGSSYSPSFRKQTRLDSPHRGSPRTAASTPSRLGKYSIDSKNIYMDSRASPSLKTDLLLIIVSVTLATFCATLDKTIVSTAIPQITTAFDSTQDIGWYGSSYLISICSCQLLYGKLYHFYTTKWIFISALAIFELGSLVSGLAGASGVLIFGRILAGCGAAGLLPGAVLVVSQIVSSDQKLIYFTILAGASSLALVIAPLVGGVLTEYASWRFCFYINLPLGLISCFLMVFLFKPISDLPNKRYFKGVWPYLDLEGTLLFVPSVSCLLLALQFGGVKYQWSSPVIIVLFAIFFVTMSGYALIQHYKNDLASIRPHIIRNRTVIGGMMVFFCLGASTSVLMYYLPIWFQAIKNATPLQSGAMLVPLVLSIAITSIVSGSLIKYIGHYMPFLLFSTLMMSVGAGLLTTLNSNTASATSIGYQIVFGIGAGCGLQQSMVAVQALFMRPGDLATVSAMMTFAQTLGGAVAIGIAQSAFENKLLSSISAANLPGLDDSGVTTNMNALLLNEGNSGVLLNIFNGAIDQAFYVAVALAAASILGVLAMEWRSVRGKSVLFIVQ